MAEYIHATRRMMYMVKAVDLTLESLYSGRALERAIWRYEALWLPLLAALSDPPVGNEKPRKPPVWRHRSFTTKVDEIRSKNFSKGGLWLTPSTIVPPIDIAWIWHCHRLNPIAFREDLARFVPDGDFDSAEYMQKACGANIETAFVFSDGEDVQSKGTRRLWDIIYPFEAFMPKYLLSHSFSVEESKKRQHITSFANEITRASFRSVLVYDLATASRLQKSFLYQIIDEDDPEKGELFEGDEYLQRAYRRYINFLRLHQQVPEDFLLVPMNDINIIWHTHLSCTTEYIHDCLKLINRIVRHDPIAVEDIRLREVAEIMAERANNDRIESDPNAMEDDEFAELQEKRGRGISIRETKAIWESTYGAYCRYDLPDTLYRGQPKGERGGYITIFEKLHGATKDITWTETILRMLVAILIFALGNIILLWAFYKTMVSHGKYLIGLPLGVGIMGLGVYTFLAIPISRPLSSQSRFWLEQAYRQTHDPLPPYLISSTKKIT